MSQDISHLVCISSSSEHESSKNLLISIPAAIVSWAQKIVAERQGLEQSSLLKISEGKAGRVFVFEKAHNTL